ncbi:MAG: membrane associated rhomboid family serine protease [Planctomycetota bacterium]|jgi:membrane associated rhomboid family serine protease
MLDKDFILNLIKEKLRNRNIVTQLILINIGIYLIGLVLNVFGLAFGFQEELMADYFSEKYLYIPSFIQSFIYQPYTLLTYQFLHGSFFHLFSNMVVVYYFGNIFIQLTHKKKLLPLYILGGFFAGLFYLLIFFLVPALQVKQVYLVGSSGSVMAILAAVATLIPEREILLFARFKVKFKWIAFFFLGLSIIRLTGPNSAGDYAHLGGLLFGYLFVMASKNGLDLAKPFNKYFNMVLSYFDFEKKPRITFVNNQFKDKKKFKSTKKGSKEDLQKVDAILDKIKESGYDKLTKAEKAFLFQNSNK